MILYRWLLIEKLKSSCNADFLSESWDYISNGNVVLIFSISNIGLINSQDDGLSNIISRLITYNIVWVLWLQMCHPPLKYSVQWLCGWFHISCMDDPGHDYIAGRGPVGIAKYRYIAKKSLNYLLEIISWPKSIIP